MVYTVKSLKSLIPIVCILLKNAQHKCEASECTTDVWLMKQFHSTLSNKNNQDSLTWKGTVKQVFWKKIFNLCSFLFGSYEGNWNFVDTHIHTQESDFVIGLFTKFLKKSDIVSYDCNHHAFHARTKISRHLMKFTTSPYVVPSFTGVKILNQKYMCSFSTLVQKNICFPLYFAIL